MGWLQKMLQVRQRAQVQMRLKMQMRKLDRVQALRQTLAVQHFQVWVWTLWAIVSAFVLLSSDAQHT